MKFGFRTPSLKNRIAARTSVKRVVRQNLGLNHNTGGFLRDNRLLSLINQLYFKPDLFVNYNWQWEKHTNCKHLNTDYEK